MKKGIHPEYRPIVFQDPSCDFAILTKSTMKSWIDKTKPVEIDNDTTITKEELQKILKENAKIKEENEILKKAITIFTKN